MKHCYIFEVVQWLASHNQPQVLEENVGGFDFW